MSHNHTDVARRRRVLKIFLTVADQIFGLSIVGASSEHHLVNTTDSQPFRASASCVFLAPPGCGSVPGELKKACTLDHTNRTVTRAGRLIRIATAQPMVSAVTSSVLRAGVDRESSAVMWTHFHIRLRGYEGPTKTAEPSYIRINVMDYSFPNNSIVTTKYTFYNFLPKNLFEQFRRLTNLYFLLIVIITLIPSLTPLTPTTSITPLVFVLVVTALREGYEDWRRWQDDRKANTRLYSILSSDGSLVSTRSDHLRVGDMLFLSKGDLFPADLVALATALDDGVCYVETSQLDGETNLKVFKALKETTELEREELSNLQCAIECEEPHAGLYTFHGRLKKDGKTISLDSKQLLLRGASLRNTPWVYAVVVYNGEDTKLSLNQKAPPSKFSSVERRMNRIVLAIFIFQIICVLIMGLLAGIFQTVTINDMDYLGPVAAENGAIVGIKTFFSYIVLLSFLIPQSLMVTLELVKFGQAAFMNWDEKMRLDPEDGKTGLTVKTSNLNDELALVKYIFSDKTGTLTQNRMEFSHCSINGEVYANAMGGELRKLLTDNHWTPKSQAQAPLQVQRVVDFLKILSQCHAVVVDEDQSSGKPSFQSASPDEVALVEAAAASGFVFKSSTSKGFFTTQMGTEVQDQLLCSIEFTSERASSSVIVRDAITNKIYLYSKGADSKMLKRIKTNTAENQRIVDLVTKQIDQFSEMGLRTLVLAKRELSEEIFQSWIADYRDASSSLINRGARIAAVCQQIEEEMELIGCTAIEDKLQDEVPETIEFLIQAGIKLWVITGDKQQTAINIGYSTRLLTANQKKIIVNVPRETDDPSDEIRVLLERGISDNQGNPDLGLIIDGEALVFALKDYPDLFLELSGMCKSVVCCRASPLQKAQIVRLVKNHKGDITLSIGDGANDVSMIQEAHIGVGIYGREGTQAARASDYAMMQFKGLKRLIVVHGRYSFVRNVGCIHVSLYKNMAFFFVFFWFSFFSLYSSETIYDDYIVTLFNIVFTSSPPFFIGIHDKDIPEEVAEERPEVFVTVQDGQRFTVKTALLWLLSAFYHSLVFFIVGWLAFDDIINSDGKTSDLVLVGMTVSTSGVIVVLFKMGMGINSWNPINILFHVLSLGGYLLAITILSALHSGWGRNYYAFYTLVQTPIFYLTIVVTMAFCIVPDLSLQYIWRQYRPTLLDVIQESDVVVSSVRKKTPKPKESSIDLFLTRVDTAVSLSDTTNPNTPKKKKSTKPMAVED
ncbi:hypothetical protein PROFUN_09120 [Planoprotostelium fungivorum]|uniref:Phospholipid-transporting ATPase n=1 Tax=Planoprotostelium fungivorum TaxID=1890364 RepID=A0A2P6NI10_9EUKA|nr:hypothetical protein PROFUN_09120 [Planoprotostelium fungivorum]